MNNFFLFENLNFVRIINVVNGFVIIIMNIDMVIVILNIFGNLEGKDNNFNIKNNIICIIYEILLKK